MIGQFVKIIYTKGFMPKAVATLCTAGFLMYSIPTFAATTPASTEPGCGKLGYSNTLEPEDCHNKYFTCPLNSSYIKCDEMAEIGDIKYSEKSYDHDGWYLCNGRQTRNETSLLVPIGSKLSAILIERGFSVPLVIKLPGSSTGQQTEQVAVLPNYLGTFLSGFGTSSYNSKDSNTKTSPLQTGRVGSHTHSFPIYQFQGYGKHEGNWGGSTNVTRLVTGQPTISNNSGTDTCPFRIGLYPFIYAGTQ